MIGLRLPLPGINHALAAGTLLLAGIAVWPWLVPPSPPTRPLAAAQAGTPAPLLAPLQALASYAAIVERPLFAPSRRPAPGVSTIGPTIESRYRLVGIMGNGAKRKAYIAEGARRTEIAAGDLLDGWTVKEIGQDRVVLASPAGEAVLKLTRIVVPEAPKPQ